MIMSVNVFLDCIYKLLLNNTFKTLHNEGLLFIMLFVNKSAITIKNMLLTKASKGLLVMLEVQVVECSV